MWHPPPLLPDQSSSWQPREEDPGDLYLKILAREGKPEYLHALAWSLGRQPDHVKALAMAQRLGTDPDPAFRCLGVVALAELHDQGLREAERALVRLAADQNERVRATIPYELKYQTTQESTAILLQLAQDPSALVRSHVARGIHVYSHPDAKACFIRFLKDVEASVRAAALDNYTPCEDGLKEPWPEICALRLDPSEDVRRLLPGWLQDLPVDEGTPLLIEMSRDESAQVRASAVAYMRDEDSPLVLARLLECVADREDCVRIEAVDRLLSWSCEEVTAALLECAKDRNSTVRKFAAQGLESRATMSMLPLLERLAEDEDNMYTRRATARALGTLRGPESELILTGMLRDPSKAVQKTVKKILEQWAKDGPIDRNTELTLRHGPKGARVTRDAFLAAGKGSLKVWESFVERTQTLDGVPSGDTEHGPAVVMTAHDGETIGLLPFGPAHWIRIEHWPKEGGQARMSYSLLTSQEVTDWLKDSPHRHIHAGRKILKRYQWD